MATNAPATTGGSPGRSALVLADLAPRRVWLLARLACRAVRWALRRQEARALDAFYDTYPGSLSAQAGVSRVLAATAALDDLVEALDARVGR